jgi:hypothetical protein
MGNTLLTNNLTNWQNTWQDVFIKASFGFFPPLHLQIDYFHNILPLMAAPSHSALLVD